MSWQKINPERLSSRARQLIWQAFRNGNLEILLHPGQRRLRQAFYDNKNTITLFNTARQFGKSFLMLVLCFEQCLRHPKSQVYYAAPFNNQTNDIVEPRLSELIDLCPPELRPKKSMNKWKFPNGSKITTLGVDKDSGNRMRGMSSHLTILDECRDMDELEYIIQSVCLPQFVTTRGKLIMVSTPPTSQAHPFTSTYIKNARSRGFYWEAKWFENPMFTREQLEQDVLPEFPGGEENIRFRQEYLADYNITDSERRVVREYERAEHEAFFADYAEPEVFQPWVGMDMGFKDFTAVVFGYTDFRLGKVIIQDELMLRYAITREVADAIKERERKLWGNRPSHLPPLLKVERIGDTNEARMLAEFSRDHNLQFDIVNKRKSKVAMINNLRTMLNEKQPGGATIRINPTTCPVLSAQLETGIWNKHFTDYEYDNEDSHLDALDALKYLALEVNFSKNPFSQHAFDRTRVFVPPQSRGTGNRVFR